MYCSNTHRSQSDTYVLTHVDSTGAFTGSHHRSHRHRSIVVGGARQKLEVSSTGASRSRRYKHISQNLARFYVGLIIVHQEVLHRHYSLTASRREGYRCSQRNQGGRRVLTGITVGQTATNSGYVTDSGCGHLTVGLPHQGQFFMDGGTGGDLLLSTEGANFKPFCAIGRLFNAVKPGNPTQANDVFRLGQTLLHLKHQGGTPSHDPGIVTVSTK